MAQKMWQIELDGKQHMVLLDHKAFSGERTISVDGTHYLNEKSSFDTGSVNEIKIGAHKLYVAAILTPLGFKYDLVMDGKSQETGESVELINETPIWAWLLLVACIASFILVLGQGGAIYTGIAAAIAGMIGFVGVGNTKNPYIPASMRIGIFVVLIAVSWALAFVMRMAVQ